MTVKELKKVIETLPGDTILGIRLTVYFMR